MRDTQVMSLLRLSSVFVLLIVTSTAMAADEPKPGPKTKRMTKVEMEAVLESVSNWGRWGKDDELGTLNLITPKKRKQAASLVTDGVTVSMAHNVVKVEADGSTPFEHEMMINPPDGDFGGANDRYSVAYHGFTTTHIDALCHMFYKNQMYNGFSWETVKQDGAGRNSIIQTKNGIFTRAVLVDLPDLLGKRFLDGDDAIYPRHLDAWEKKTGIKVQSGDALLIHTGRWTRRQVKGRWEIMTEGSAGLHAECLQWLRDRDVALIGSDLALDVMPSGVEGFTLPVHIGVITQMGMCILDCCDYRAVAAECRKRQRWTFLLTVAPLAVEGGTGSPINPLATF